ncbi:hypothetical protein D0864_09595 [Hortaea werneckii]|uniref:Uncharacterized protein n=1 Tax=Hortaea werneckii TaxID=91943 RepID=A0A3M7EJR8_HORWE|nr:hypothetical protein D0864_09595 [Hortaea werneckii]
MPLSQKQMDKFYRVANLASPASARELMRVTKKKLKDEYGALGDAGGNGNSGGTPITSTPKKAGKAPAGRNGGGLSTSATTGTPSGTGKKRGRKPNGGEEHANGGDVDDVEEEEGSPLKKKGKKTGDDGVEVKREKFEQDDEESIFQ